MKQVIFFTAFFFSTMVNSQDVYRTQTGYMVVTGALQDSAIMLESSDVIVHLNYDNAAFYLKVEKSSFFSGNPYLDSLFMNHKLEFFVFDGQLDMEFINTEDHAPMEFEISGNIEGMDNIIYGNGRLEHVAEGGNISCILTMEFVLTIEELGLDFEEFNVGENFKVEILQTVLSNDWE